MTLTGNLVSERPSFTFGLENEKKQDFVIYLIINYTSIVPQILSLPSGTKHQPPGSKHTVWFCQCTLLHRTNEIMEYFASSFFQLMG